MLRFDDFKLGKMKGATRRNEELCEATSERYRIRPRIDRFLAPRLRSRERLSQDLRIVFAGRREARRKAASRGEPTRTHAGISIFLVDFLARL